MKNLSNEKEREITLKNSIENTVNDMDIINKIMQEQISKMDMQGMISHGQRLQEIVEDAEKCFRGNFLDNKKYEKMKFKYIKLAQEELNDLELIDKNSGEATKNRNITIKETYSAFFFAKVNEIKEERSKRKDRNNEQGSFVRTYKNDLKETINQSGMTPFLAKRTIELFPIMSYEDANKFESKDFSKAWSTNNNVNTYIKKLISNNVIIDLEPTRKRNKIYAINSSIFFLGKGKEKDKTKKGVMIYQKKLTEILERIEKIETEFALVTNRTSVEFSAAGLLLALFPYFHYETAYIVKDPTKSIRLPDETMTEARKRILKEEKVSRYSTIDKLTFITPNDLREMKIIGGKRSNLIDLKRALEVLELAGAIIKTNSRIRLNPSLISAVDEEIIEDDYMMFIKSEFLDEEKAVKSIKRSNQFRLMVDFDRSRSRIKQNNK